jgi:hypothetical protein
MLAPIALALLLPAGSLVAQSLSAERVDVSVDVGAQARPKPVADAFDAPLYQETEHVTTAYRAPTGTFVAAAGRYRIWKRLTVGVGFSTVSRDGAAAVTARVPHPFFDNQFRTVDGTAATRRDETAVFATIGWRVPLGKAVRLSVNAGPASLLVRQSLVTDVKVTEAYPFDTATFGSATIADSSRRAAGVYAGLDTSWMFAKHFGAGGVVQVTHARVRERAGDRTVSIDGGGAQGGAGLRLVF